MNLLKRWRKPLTLSLIVAGFLMLALAIWLLGDLPAPMAENLRPIRPSTFIYDRNGRLLYEVIGEEGKQVPLALEEIPAHCWQATVAVEDSRFFQHPGVDPLAIARAAYSNWRSGAVVSGASTLTQQLARNTLMMPEERYEQSLRRKLREAWLALQIELRFSKQEILAMYLNQVYYGNFAYGLEAAANAYFAKPAQELDLAECSLLAGLVQSPGVYNPLNDLEAAKWRQATVLSLLVWNGYIERPDAELALAETLQFAASPFQIEAPHFVSYVETQLERLAERLQGAGADPSSPDLSGLRVTTTLDLGWQQQAEAIIRRRLQQLHEDPAAPADRRVENAALLALDPQTGAILAMVGSPDYFDPQIDGAVNGSLALRQPGSTIKPITYAAALDPARAAAAGRQPLSAATVIADVRTAFLTAEGEPYVPQNYDLAWHGPVSARVALASSYNLPAVKVLDMIGVNALIDQAQKQGITTFQPAGPGPDGQARQRYGLALTLGGGEVSLLQLTGAYAAFANGGRRVEPFAIQRVETLDGEVLFDASRFTLHASRVLDPRVAYLITDILSDNDARAPSFGRNSVLRLSLMRAAVKTGTTTDWRDNWTIGYTPDLVAGVWVGNADNAPMLGVSGVSGAGPIWHDFMEMALRYRPARAFVPPDGLVRAEICIDSGLLPTDAIACTRRRTELFIAGTEPVEFDTVYRQTANGVVRVYPPELQAWARENGIAQPGEDSSQLSIVNSELLLTSPDPNRVFRLSPDLPAEVQQVRLAARPADQNSIRRVTFLVNGQPVGQAAQPPYEVWWPLQPGSHAIGALAENAAGQEIPAEPLWIEVR